ncbi:MAG: DUF1156 domain-containing protein [Nitrososphaerota archaeon]|nr:DUF1156 domain-containing protein [Nitrososphaerota archaeon]
MSVIPKDCKRLAEVDFPIAGVSASSLHEKSIRHGHPSTLHLWWARRPLASSRALLLALLLPDPCDPNCPSSFGPKAREILSRGLVQVGPGSENLRDALFSFISRFSDWERSSDPTFISTARALVRVAYDDEPPLVADTFAGGGSIPLEALRVGCNVFAGDLNPVACLLVRTAIEGIPRAGPGLADAIRTEGKRIQFEVEHTMEDYFPKDSDGAQPLAYLWCRTVQCEAPNCGAEIPLIRSFLIVRKKGRLLALRPRTCREDGHPPKIDFDIFEPKSEADVHVPTVARAKASCLACGATLPADRLRAQVSRVHGGANPILDNRGRRTGGARLLCVVTLSPEKTGRSYRLPSDDDYRSLKRASDALEEFAKGSNVDGLSQIPEEPTPSGGGSGAGRGFALKRYGMLKWSDLYSTRQIIALVHLARAIRAIRPKSPTEEATQILLALALDKTADLSNALAPWKPDAECPVHLLARQAIAVTWDWAESTPLGESSGSFQSAYERTADAVGEGYTLTSGQLTRTELADACACPLPDSSVGVWFTDPPYYDAIPYSDLSDFFYVWLKRALPPRTIERDPFERSNSLTPKDQEIVQDEARLVKGRPKDAAFFEEGMARAFAEGRRILAETGIGCVVFAHKTTEGWEALLSGMIKSNWVLTASWPLATEMGTRLRARDSAALATSIHLVCRPRPLEAPIGDWADVARELPSRVRARMEKLTREGIRGADLVFACIGPAMEIFSRYSRVVDAQDREIPLGGDPTAAEPHEQGYLAKVWEVVGRIALEQVLGSPKGASTTLEEDARLTALFLWAMQSSAGNELVGPDEEESEIEAGTPSGIYTLVYDVVRRFAQPLGIHLNEWEGRVVETNKGVVRLLSVSERASQLFSQDDVEKLHSRWEDPTARAGRQLTLFPDQNTPGLQQKGARPKTTGKPGPSSEEEGGPRRRTTLDRLHMAMLLQANGASTPLRSLLQGEKKRGPEFERLVRSLSALYPKESEERRLVEAIALVIPR